MAPCRTIICALALTQFLIFELAKSSSPDPDGLVQEFQESDDLALNPQDQVTFRNYHWVQHNNWHEHSQGDFASTEASNPRGAGAAADAIAKAEHDALDAARNESDAQDAALSDSAPSAAPSGGTDNSAGPPSTPLPTPEPTTFPPTPEPTTFPPTPEPTEDPAVVAADRAQAKAIDSAIQRAIGSAQGSPSTSSGSSGHETTAAAAAAGQEIGHQVSQQLGNASIAGLFY